KNKVKIKFAGKKESWFEPMVREFGLEENILHVGWVSQDASLELQKSCDFLLMTSAKVIDGKDYSIAGKTFEYFAIQKPILGFVAEGAQKEMLEASKMSYVLSVDDLEASANRLYKIFTTAWALQPNTEFINSFHIKPLTRKLADLIKET